MCTHMYNVFPYAYHIPYACVPKMNVCVRWTCHVNECMNVMLMYVNKTYKNMYMSCTVSVFVEQRVVWCHVSPFISLLFRTTCRINHNVTKTIKSENNTVHKINDSIQKSIHKTVSPQTIPSMGWLFQPIELVLNEIEVNAGRDHRRTHVSACNSHTTFTESLRTALKHVAVK